MTKIIRFPSRVTGAMRLVDSTLPCDVEPMDYPNEGEVYRTAEVVALPVRGRLSPVELWIAFMLSFTAAFFIMWRQ